MSLDDIFARDEKRTRKLYDTELLTELLLLNYEFSNYKYLGVTGTNIFNNLHKKIKYSNEELEEIKNNAIALLKIKYNIKVKNFETLDFEKLD